MNKITVYLSFITVIFFSDNLFAYIGPGMGGGVIAAVVGIIVAIFLGFFAIVFYPLKRLISKKKKK
ncbi:MAG: hypothetical protein CMP44_04945 [Rickettsiales bacterium]|nr:hypothetical protein [Rickettsiales bacterium]|tara:strand:+ start:1858 stop:2055 length:198 start_codon:yes stop_codon:yes gene_type:complete